METEIRKQNVQARSCILISLKDRTEYPFKSFSEAETFLDRKHGYLSRCVKNGTGISSVRDDGEVEKFDIIVGPTIVLETVVRSPSIQPCWTCGNCYDGCSWARAFVPVNGWKAEKIFKDKDVTYNITYCPEYVSDKKRKEALDDYISNDRS